MCRSVNEKTPGIFDDIPALIGRASCVMLAGTLSAAYCECNRRRQLVCFVIDVKLAAFHGYICSYCDCVGTIIAEVITGKVKFRSQCISEAVHVLPLRSMSGRALHT